MFDPIKAMLGKAIELPMLAITGGGGNPITNMTQTRGNEPVKRPTKWGDEWEKIFAPPSLPGISRTIPLDELEYLIRLYRLDELIKKKNLGQYEFEDQDVRYLIVIAVTTRRNQFTTRTASV